MRRMHGAGVQGGDEGRTELTDQLPPLNGIARRKRSDAGILRKSTLDTFCDLFRRMSRSEQATALEVLRQIQRLEIDRVSSVPSEEIAE